MAKKPTKTVVRKKKKDNSNRNAILAFLFTLIALCNMFGMHKAGNFMICGLLSLLVAVIIKIATSPMKGIEAPTSSTGIIVDDVEDEYAKDMIATGMELLEQLARERDAISEHIFTRRINDFISVFRDMLNIVVKDYSKAPHLRKMNTYYIPTIIKLLHAYLDAKGQGASYMEINTTRDKLLKTLDQLVQAARNVKKSMIRSQLETLDIKRDVLDDMLVADGYIEDEEMAGLRQSAAAAARELPLTQQMDALRNPAPAPAAQTAPRPQQAPAARPVAPARPTAMPGLAMDAPAAPQKTTPAPQLPTSMPTASAQQMSQGAPVLHVPELFAEDDQQSDEQQTMMF